MPPLTGDPMSYQTFIANSILTSSQMNSLQSSVYTRPQTTVTASTYTLPILDRGKLVSFSNSGNTVVTIPLESLINFDIGTEIFLLNVGTGTVTIQGASGVSLNAEGGLTSLSTQWSGAILIKRAANSWVLQSTSSKVQTAELDDLSVTTEKIANASVTSAKLANGAISASQIADGTITPEKLADVEISTKTASYELVLTDKNKIIEMDITTLGNTVTVPLDSTTNFPIGSQITVVQFGTGRTQIIGPSGLSLIATPGSFLRARYSSATLLKRAVNQWYLFGDLSAS